MSEMKRDLEAVESAPRLRRGVGPGEIASAIASVAAVGVGAGTLIMHPPPRAVGFLLAAAILVILLAWTIGLRQVPSRAPWRFVDSLLAVVALGAATLPMKALIWPVSSPAQSQAWVPAGIAATALALFIVVRWRR